MMIKGWRKMGLRWLESPVDGEMDEMRKVGENDKQILKRKKKNLG